MQFAVGQPTEKSQAHSRWSHAERAPASRSRHCGVLRFKSALGLEEYGFQVSEQEYRRDYHRQRPPALPTAALRMAIHLITATACERID